MKLDRRISRATYISLATSGLLIFLLTWSLVAYAGLISPFFLPTPAKVLSTMFALISDGALFADIFASMYRILFGFLVSLAVSLPLGIALGLSRKVEAFAEPLIAFVRYIPPSAFIPLAIIWFGIGDVQKIAIVFLGVAPYLTLLVADIVVNTRRELVEAALTLGASFRDVVTKVVIPNSMPGIWDSLRIMIGAAWTFVIIAEIVGASSGLGHLIIESQRFLRTDIIFAVVVIIGFLGLATDYLFKLIYRVLFPWTEKTHASA